jgi:phage terminase small subunit
MKSTTVNRKAKALLDHGKIRARLDALSEQVTDRVLYDSTSYLERLIAIDQMDICDILNDDWTLKPLSEWPQIWRSYISAIDVHEIHAGAKDPDVAISVIKKIKWPDKLKNLELLGKHKAVQAFTPDKEGGVPVEYPEIIEIVAYNPNRRLTD